MLKCSSIKPNKIMFEDLARLTIVSFFAFALPTITTANSSNRNDDNDGKCELVGTFSLLTQAFLGLLCLSSLIIKRFYEHPVRRTWQVWFYDVSKQVIGSLGVHIFNLMLSILKSSPSVFVKSARGACEGSDECVGDPCDWYFLSIVLDCTIGVYILYLVLLLMSTFCKNYIGITQIESGEYGPDDHRPSFKAFTKQLALYFGSLMITKFLLYGFVECFENQLLWITSHIILSWLDEYPNEFEIFIVMFVVPIFMNCLQLILVDNIIQNKTVYSSNHKFENETSPLVMPNVDVSVNALSRSQQEHSTEGYMSVT